MRPLESTGSYPDDYKRLLTRSYKDVSSEQNGDIATLPLYLDTDIEIKDLLKSGTVLFGDTLTAYVRRIGKKMLGYSSVNAGQVNFYVLRNTVPNAYTFADGSVFVTTGLLGRLSSESQVAFVLGHEISHYQRKHSLKEFQKENELKKEFDPKLRDENSYIRLMHYSKDNELEADQLGMELMMRAGYNGLESPKALHALNPLDSVQLKNANLSKFFKSDIFNYDSIVHAVTEPVTRVRIFMNTNDESGNDKEETHPALDKRIIALQELLKNTNYKFTGSADSIVYTPIKIQALFEMTEDAYLDGRYGESLYLSMIMLERYPKNKYLEYSIARDLFWLSEYKNQDLLDDILDPVTDNYGLSYEKFKSFFNALTENDLKKLCYSFIRSRYSEELKDDDIHFYMAYLSEYYLGKGVSRYYYNKYLDNFPGGKYAGIVKTKLGS